MFDSEVKQRTEILSQLITLGELKATGILSEEEFKCKNLRPACMYGKTKK